MPHDDDFDERKITKRRDDALRRALNTPPKHHKDMKKGKRGDSAESSDNVDEPPAREHKPSSGQR